LRGSDRGLLGAQRDLLGAQLALLGGEVAVGLRDLLLVTVDRRTACGNTRREACSQQHQSADDSGSDFDSPSGCGGWTFGWWLLLVVGDDRGRTGGHGVSLRCEDGCTRH